MLPEKDAPVKITFTLPKEQLPVFYPLLQRGFWLDCRVGSSIQQLLVGQLGIDPDYLEVRLKTIFLDGKAVDDLERAILRDGSVLALSAAMPGLAGASLRRQGPFAPLRAQITHAPAGSLLAEKEGRVFLKLFNLALLELGPVFLARGVRVESGYAREFLAGLAEEVRRKCVGLAAQDWPGKKEMVTFVVNFPGLRLSPE